MITKVSHLVRVIDGPLFGALPSDAKAGLSILQRFNTRLDRLERSAFWRRYADQVPEVISRMENLQVEKTSDTKFEMKGMIFSALENFNQDEVAAFILDFRQFIQKNDPISVRALSKIYGGSWISPAARRQFEKIRDDVNRLSRRPTKIMFGEHTIAIGDLFDVVMYGGLAHANTQKAEVFESWEKSGIMGFVWAEFFAHLRDMMGRLKAMRALNSQIIAVLEPVSPT